MLTKLNNSNLSKFKESLSKRTEWVCYSGANANRRYIVTSLTKMQHYSKFKELHSGQNSVGGPRVNNICVYTLSITLSTVLVCY